MTRSRVVQAAISDFYRRRASAATSTSYCSSSFISRSIGNAGIKHLRFTSSVSMAMPSSPTTPTLPLDHFPSRGFRFHSFASMGTLSLYHFASRNEVAKSNIEKSIFATSDRGFSSSNSSTSSSTGGAEEGGENANHHLDEAAFHAAADETLHDLVDALETWVDCEVEGDEADVEYSSGVLTLKLGEGKGTYVINKQAPNRQLWLSSPVSGPVRYDLVSPPPSPSSPDSSSHSSSSSSSSSDSSKWIYHRDGHEMRDRLREELAGLYGKAPEGL